MMMQNCAKIERRNPSRKRIAVLAFCLIVVHSLFILAAAAGAIDYFVAFGVIPAAFIISAFALVVTAGRSRRQR